MSQAISLARYNAHSCFPFKHLYVTSAVICHMTGLDLFCVPSKAHKRHIRGPRLACFTDMLNCKPCFQHSNSPSQKMLRMKLGLVRGQQGMCERACSTMLGGSPAPCLPPGPPSSPSEHQTRKGRERGTPGKKPQRCCLA